MQKFEENKVDTKLLRQLTPVSRVMLRAMMETTYGRTYANQAVEFLAEAQKVWKNEHPEKGFKHPGAYYLGRTYQHLEYVDIINAKGQVLNGKALAAPQLINGRLCRPRAFASICYEQTATFKKLRNPIERSLVSSR